jgi:putative Holliday junction resolvase
MKILGIDYGRKKIGLALAESMIAEPFMVLRFDDFQSALEKLTKLIETEKIEKVVMGISEGEMERETRDFSERLGKAISVPLEFENETLSTFEAQKKAIEAGVGRKKRKSLEDAFAASVVLQSYLDTNV